MPDNEALAQPSDSESPICVVGIGASAGGLEAISEMLVKIPDSTGMAFVIIQHLSPDYKSMLSEILCKYTMMPVIQAENGMRLERNSVYLIPPRFNMEVRNGRLILHEHEHTTVVNHPIDIFFKSLAREYETHAVAIVLSGTGSDGTNGIRTIKEESGVILVQRPETAKFDGMPRSAIATGFADMVISPEAIAEELTHIALSVSNGTMGMSDEELLNKVFSILKKVSGVNYTYYKPTTITRRIERRMVVKHAESLYDYVDLLRSDSAEAEFLAKDVLIGVTSFFRDPECFDALKEHAIRPLVENCPPERSIRVWCAGCATGEEAYSLAILFSEVMEETQSTRKVKIFATDLDKDAIAVASNGVYGENIIDDVSAQRLGRFFVKKGSTYTVSRELRQMVVFAPQNVFQDPPFARLDLISCRNMMIYFQPVLQKDMFAIFHMALNDGGYLFLGKSEGVGGCGDIFNPLCPPERIFVHDTSGHVPKDVKIRYSIPALEESELPIAKSTLPEMEDEEGELRLEVLEEYMPPCLLVDEQNRIVHVFGECNNFLRFARGKVDGELFGSLTQDLRIAVSTALKMVRDTGERTGYENIPVHGEHRNVTVSLVVSPVEKRDGERSEFTAIVLMEQRDGGTPKGTMPYDANAAAAKRISDLEKDLAKSQMDLKKSVSEQETVNEELQATNEELLTANEELQSSNEELQSVNEELYTVNSEYQEKLTEITELNDDVSNFMSSTMVGIVFLDSQFQIRRFTEYAGKEFNIMEQDIGRPLRFMAYNLINVDLQALCDKVAAKLAPVEMDVVSASGKSYFMRVAPYLTDDQRISGLVITFVDTTPQNVGTDDVEVGEMKDALDKARQANQEKDNFLSRMSHDMRTPLNAIIGMSQLSLAEDELDDRVRERMRTIEDNGVYLLGIINEILETSRITAGKMALQVIPTSESEFLGSILPLVRSQAEEKDVALTNSMLGVTDKTILLDRNHVTQVLVNLIGNAIKFSPTAGKVDFETVSTELPDGRVRHEYTITDNGCGMSKDFQKKMYQPFEQEETVSRGERVGSGLGLFITKKLVDEMDGRIECVSRPGAGTTFKLSIDYAKKGVDLSGGVQQPTPEQLRVALSGKRVLICEDQEVNAIIAREMLGHVGMLSDVATNGREAVEMFDASTPGYYAAILMDIRMPDMNGREASVAIRAKERPDARRIPIIAMTADSFADDRSGCINAGMNDCVFKPLDMETLNEMIYRYAVARR
ncbi:MAG: chemotaxis protein CheB [Atopobiaceae bacterium]|jgi:two-component system CheB/CheR fusion protein|nr:ATP-binding protein [Atopobiaceae bacterium]